MQMLMDIIGSKIAMTPNPMIYPTALELLNGIDDDCDLFWDEGYNLTDADSDNLSDYSEISFLWHKLDKYGYRWRFTN